MVDVPTLLAGKEAVVTGGASGNGREIALTFAACGADVVVADIRESPREGGKPTADEIEQSTDSRACHVDCDVTDLGDLERAVDAAEEFGGIDVMVNNAGIVEPEDFLETTEDEYYRFTDINVKGPFFGSQFAAERMVGAGGGSIINVSSISGFLGSQTSVTYSLTKGAVRLLTYALAAELGPHGIRVNAIHPGLVETEMTAGDAGIDFDDEAQVDALTSDIPLRRVAQPEDVANAALYLASDLASHVTAESLLVDGGKVNTDFTA